MAFCTSARNQIRSDIKSQTRIQTCYPLLTPTPQRLHSVTPSVAFVSIRSTKSLFTVFRPFLNAAIIYAHTHSNCTDPRRTHKPNTPSLKAAHKMPPVRQTKIQNGRQLDLCVYVWEQSRVFCVDWEVGSVPVTDPDRRQIKTALFSRGERQTEASRLHPSSPRPPYWRSTGEQSAALHILTEQNIRSLLQDGYCQPTLSALSMFIKMNVWIFLVEVTMVLQIQDSTFNFKLMIST